MSGNWEADGNVIRERIVVGHEECGCEIRLLAVTKGHRILATSCGGDVFAVQDGRPIGSKAGYRRMLEYRTDAGAWAPVYCDSFRIRDNCLVAEDSRVWTARMIASGRLRAVARNGEAAVVFEPE